MDDNKIDAVVEPATDPVEPVIEPVEPVEGEPTPAEPTEPAAASELPEETPVVTPESEFKKDEDDDKNKCKKEEDDEDGDDGDETPEPTDDKDPKDDEDEDKKKFALLEAEHAELQQTYAALESSHNELQSNYDALKASYDELVEFKRQIDDAKKDQMIESFTMLSDEEKAEISSNKANYSLEEIEEKLSVICFRKGNFNSTASSKNNNNTEASITTFNFNGVTGSAKPAWLSAVDNNKINKY